MDTPTIQAVAFDLDGLMFDTESLFFRVADEMLRERGKVFTKEIMARMIGRQAPVAGLALKTMAGLEESVETLMLEARARFNDLIDSAVHPTPGLFALLDHLAERRYPLAVATSSRRVYAEGLLTRHKLIDRFRFLLTAEDVTNSKPDPEIYHKAAERFGVAPSALLVLEDSPAGTTAARTSGAFVVGVPHEHSPAEALGHAHKLIPRLDAEALLALLP